MSSWTANTGKPNRYRQLTTLKQNSVLTFDTPAGQVALCPDMGGRVFAEFTGQSLHRIDLQTVADPQNTFNNFGGANFWPAPEGGNFAFNYRGDTWYVQQAVNNQPFNVIHKNETSAKIAKDITLINRAEAVIDVVMQRELAILTDLPPILHNAPLRDWLSYQTIDSFDVVNEISTEEALIAAWTLEQFDATAQTVSFAVVEHPRAAINFDFYDHPRERIHFHAQGFTYQTDGRQCGQIGINKSAGTRCVGFYDLSRCLLCLRQNLSSPQDGVFFNIADNNQSNGPYSAADNYSIYNSDPNMRAFELETIGAANVENNRLKGSRLISNTTFACFEQSQDLKKFVASLLGYPE